MVTDTSTITSFIVGKSKRRYTLAEVSRAEERGPSDPEARILLDDIEHDEIDMEQILHDCPECRAELARGVRPIIGTGADLAKMIRRPRSRVFDRKPRWRTRKRPS